jgi:hypothetical protein
LSPEERADGMARVRTRVYTGANRSTDVRLCC